MVRPAGLCSSRAVRRGMTLGEILRRTLAGAPVALTVLGGALITSTDAGVDCSACATVGLTIDCNPVTLNGKPELSCNVSDECVGGRRPASLLATRARPTLGLGAYFAAAARLEEASVLAFRVLAGELSAHRAPPALVDWCRRSAVEEIVHTRLTSGLARRYGAMPERAAYS